MIRRSYARGRAITPALPCTCANARPERRRDVGGRQRGEARAARPDAEVDARERIGDKERSIRRPAPGAQPREPKMSESLRSTPERRHTGARRRAVPVRPGEGPPPGAPA